MKLFNPPFLNHKLLPCLPLLTLLLWTPGCSLFDSSDEWKLLNQYGPNQLWSYSTEEYTQFALMRSEEEDTVIVRPHDSNEGLEDGRFGNDIHIRSIGFSTPIGKRDKIEHIGVDLSIIREQFIEEDLWRTYKSYFWVFDLNSGKELFYKMYDCEMGIFDVEVLPTDDGGWQKTVISGREGFSDRGSIDYAKGDLVIHRKLIEGRYTKFGYRFDGKSYELDTIWHSSSYF